MGAKFQYHKFQSSINPFGILFHPLAIENLITRAIHKNYYKAKDLFFNNEKWCCLDVHSKFNNSSKEDLLAQINSEIDSTHDQLKTVTHVIITLGTSWVYRHMASDKIVANCHKLPQKQFQKELLSVEQITRSLLASISLFKSVNPQITILFTVSPVRHIKDGFVENTRSKSHLLTAIHQVVESTKQIYYFPSYEIMMDELRDYRFYDRDMLHPNALAIDYIWNTLKTIWFSERALKMADIVASIQAKKAHRPFNETSETHQQFLIKLKLEIDDVVAKHPHISF